MTEKLRQAVETVQRLLAEGRYDELASITRGVRLTARDMRKAVDEYGRTVVPPPADAYSLMDVIPVTGPQPKRWSISMPLWTKEEGRSDLSIELTLIEDKETNGYRVEFDNIHVL